MKFLNNYTKIINLLLISSTLIFFTYTSFQNINHLLFKNSFTEINSRVPGGIKFSLNNGLTSYGMFGVGLKNPDPSLNGNSLSNNIYENTKAINTEFLEKGNIGENYIITSYKKTHGIYTRVLPFIIYKVTSIFSNKFVFVEYFYLITSLLVFFRIYYKIQLNYTLTHSLIFFFVYLTNGYFLIFLKSIVGPFSISIFPLFLLSFNKFYKKIVNKQSTTALIFLLLPPTLLGNTQGPIIWLSFITGLYLYNKNFIFNNNKKIIYKALLINIFCFILSEFLWIFQRLVLLKESWSEVLEIIILSFGKYFQFVETSNLNSCANVNFYEYFELFLNIKLIDLIFIEINVLTFFVTFFIFLLLNFQRKKVNLKLLIMNNLQVYFVLSTNIFWFLFIKGAFSCHLHVYPKFLLLSFIPVLFTIKLNE